MGKYQNKYRIDSSRARWWDYGWNGAYFITICTRDREHFFGEIENEKMVLNPLGAIAYVLWHEIPHRMKYVELGEFVVMPNHIHGILIIVKPDVETLHATSLQKQKSHLQQQPNSRTIPSSIYPEIKNEKMAAISPKSNSISTIIRSYKSAVSRYAGRLGLQNGWQTRFHDHIIRSDADYERISNYIINNPKSWGEDKLNVKK